MLTSGTAAPVNLGTFDRRAIPACARESRWTTPDGAAIRRIDWDRAGDASPRGSLLFLPGRGDFYEKYLETLDHWAQAGWQVTASDWRWQAGSGRHAADPRVGDVSDFSVWVDDLAALWAQWTAQTPGPHVIVGHSMGGHLVLRALAEGRIAPDAVVLSAPMLGFVTPIPGFVQRAVARLMCRIADPARMAWSASEKPGSPPAARHVLLTHDADRYADELWWRVQRPELDLGPGSWRWVERASASNAGLAAPGVLEGVRAPILILATRFDGLVSWGAIRRAARRLPRAELVAWGREGRHELLREVDAVRDRAVEAIDDFLDRMAPAPQG